MHRLTRTGFGQAERRCLRWRQWQPGDPTDAEVVCAQWSEPPPPQTTPTTPTTPPRSCSDVVRGWAPLLQCANLNRGADYNQLVAYCAQHQRGSLNWGQLIERVRDFDARRCAENDLPPGMEPTPPPRQPSDPPTMPPGIPDPGTTPPGTPPLIEEPPDVTPNGDTPPEGVAQRDWQRRFGPVVGIGLLVAVGLTVYRVKRKRTKR